MNDGMEPSDARPEKGGAGREPWEDKCAADKRCRRTSFHICLCLAAITVAVFEPTFHHGFVDYDDGPYVYENTAVEKGLSFEGIRWAFTHVHAGNWHPLTTITHMLDCRLYGLNAGGHHLTSVLLHSSAAILLFLVLRTMTGALWRAAFAAALFAVHPLRVESVAWVAERKDVLSGVFFMLTVWAHARYARKQTPGRYVSVMSLFALGLMSKPMLVTLPFVLLLLDYWPLDRFRPGAPADAGREARDRRAVIWRLLREKIPLLALAAATCVATLIAQKESIQPIRVTPVLLRLGNAVVSTGVYLTQMFYPAGLSVFYPYARNGIAFWEAGFVGILLVGVSWAAWVSRRRQPWALVGWLWYVGMLVPVIGLIQVGSQAHADRYTYLPQIGLYVLVTWMAADACRRWRCRCWAVGCLMAAVIGVLAVISRVQVEYWKNSEVLWRHALDCTPRNETALNNLGGDLLQQGRVEEAIDQFQMALECQPGSAEARHNLGLAFFRNGRVDEAIARYQEALRIRPDYAEAHSDLGTALLQKERVDEAIAQYQRALELQPGLAEAHAMLGNALLAKGQMDAAIPCFKRALELKPDCMEALNNLGLVFLWRGQAREAIVHFQTALKLKPGSAEVYCNLGKALLVEKRASEAAACFQKALELKPGLAEAHLEFGNVCFQEGRAEEAVVHYQRASELEPNNVEALNTLAWVLSTSPDKELRDGVRAVRLARRADQLEGGGNPSILRTLAAACAETGRFSEAVDAAERALRLAKSQADAALAEAIRREITLYRSGSPVREANQPLAPQPGARK